MYACNEFRRLAALLDVKVSPDHDLGWVITQVRALYREIPGLVLTFQDLQDAVGLDGDSCDAVLWSLTNVGFLRVHDGGFLMAER